MLKLVGRSTRACSRGSRKSVGNIASGTDGLEAGCGATDLEVGNVVLWVAVLEDPPPPCLRAFLTCTPKSLLSLQISFMRSMMERKAHYELNQHPRA